MSEAYNGIQKIQPIQKETFGLGLSSVEEEQERTIWSVYQASGNAAEAARQTGLPYHTVRRVLNDDPIRKLSIVNTRAEEVVARWEARETQASNSTKLMLDLLEGLIGHVARHLKAGSDLTDLTGVFGRIVKRLTPIEAVQWLIQNGALDQAQRVGYNALKATETIRQMVLQSEHGEDLSVNTPKGDPHSLSDSELRKLVGELRASGQEVPWGLALHHDRKLSPASAASASSG